MKRLLRGGRVVDPANGVDGQFDVLIEGGTIGRVGRDLPVEEGMQVIDVPSGFVVVPGLIDMHVHFREPGQEHKETIASGARSAVAGGFTAVACMPNTSPVNDSASITELMLKKAAEANLARVYPIGAVSRGSQGELLADIAELHRAGCCAISDDGKPVATALLMRRALEYASMFDMPVIDHCEDVSLKADGVAHEGFVASTLGLPGLPAAAETVMVQRDVTLAGMTGGHFHLAHMSVRGALRAIREGKSQGFPVTCEVAPHHFVLTDAFLESPIQYDTNCKMNPPLREQADVDAMIEGIADGSVDVISTDHAPHHSDEKLQEFDRAPFGIVGLETCVPLVLDRLVHAGHVSLARAVELLSVNPARVIRRPGGSLAEGQVADITVLAPDAPVTIVASKLQSKSKNTPFDGWTLRGAAAATIVGGRTVYTNPEVAGAATFA